jgi:hypothetical protein
VPLSPADVLYPVGRISPDLLPDRSPAELAADVGGWLDEAYALERVAALEAPLQDRAARAWAEHRAFDAACVRMSALPTAITQADQGSHQYARDQRETICALAAGALAEFESVAPLPVPAATPLGSRTTHHTFSW